LGWLGDSVAQGRRRIDFEGVWYDGRDMNRRSFFHTCLSAAGAITLRDRADAAGPEVALEAVPICGFELPHDEALDPLDRA
jgi:hypothetical protein